MSAATALPENQSKKEADELKTIDGFLDSVETALKDKDLDKLVRLCLSSNQRLPNADVQKNIWETVIPLFAQTLSTEQLIAVMERTLNDPLTRPEIIHYMGLAYIELLQSAELIEEAQLPLLNAGVLRTLSKNKELRDKLLTYQIFVPVDNHKQTDAAKSFFEEILNILALNNIGVADIKHKEGAFARNLLEAGIISPVTTLAYFCSTVNTNFSETQKTIRDITNVTFAAFHEDPTSVYLLFPASNRLPKNSLFQMNKVIVETISENASLRSALLEDKDCPPDLKALAQEKSRDVVNNGVIVLLAKRFKEH